MRCHSVGCEMTLRIMQSDTQCSSRLHVAVIRVYYATGNVIEAHEHKGEFKEW